VLLQSIVPFPLRPFASPYVNNIAHTGSSLHVDSATRRSADSMESSIFPRILFLSSSRFLSPSIAFITDARIASTGFPENVERFDQRRALHDGGGESYSHKLIYAPSLPLFRRSRSTESAQLNSRVTRTHFASSITIKVVERKWARTIPVVPYYQVKSSRT